MVSLLVRLQRTSRLFHASTILDIFSEKQQALRFIVHIVGGLHQHLHVGNGSDKGGNDVHVTFCGQPTNLYAVWDSGLLDDEQLSNTKLSAWLLMTQAKRG